MGVANPYQILDDDMQMALGGAYRPETGFIENWQAALHQSLTEDTPILSRLIPSDTESMYKKKIYGYVSDGTISPEAYKAYRGDFGGLMDYASKELGLPDIPTQEAFNEAKMNEYANYRKTADNIYKDQSKWGMVGQFAGAAHAITLDPLYATAFFTGYGGAATALQAAIRVGAIEGGIELAAQPLIAEFKDDIGADYGASEMIANVLLATIGGGALAGAGKAIERLTVGASIKKIKELGLDKDPNFRPIWYALSQYDDQYKVLDALNEGELIDNSLMKQGANGTDPGDVLDTTPEEVFIREEATFAERMGIVETAKATLRDERMALTQQGDALTENMMKKLAPLAEEKAALSTTIKDIRAAMKSGTTPELETDLQILLDAYEGVQQAITDLDLPSLVKNRAAIADKIKDLDARGITETVEVGLEDAGKVLNKVDEVVEAAAPERAKIDADTQTASQRREPIADVADGDAIRYTENIQIMEECL